MRPNKKAQLVAEDQFAHKLFIVVVVVVVVVVVSILVDSIVFKKGRGQRRGEKVRIRGGKQFSIGWGPTYVQNNLSLSLSLSHTHT